MVRMLALACACVLPLMAPAQDAGRGVKDYQRIAEQPPAPTALFGRKVDLPPGYSLRQIAHPTRGNGTQTAVMKVGKQVLAWDTATPQFVVHRGILYRAEYHPGCPGCAVIAFDLEAGKEVWRTGLRATGVCAFHSFYLNGVTIEQLDDDTLRVTGRETFGDYVEIVELRTGKTVGHKVVHPEWMKPGLAARAGQ